MNTVDAIEWLDTLLQQRESLSQQKDSFARRYFAPYDRVFQWLADGEAALRKALPPPEPLVQRWAASIDQTEAPASGSNVDRATALLRSARELLASGRVGSLFESIRAETVVEILDQADELLSKGATFPAIVVLVGGALETHLRHLCERADPTRADTVWSKSGSIDAYKAALDRARKAGNEIISIGDAKQVTAWGDRRNKAAHTPLELDLSKDGVRLMIDGAREFITRTSAP